MQDIAQRLAEWHHQQARAYAVATVVGVRGSAPRQPGAALAVNSEGEAAGSVSGGCVEAAVYELCREALQHGTPVLESFGYSDEDAFAVGLTCGGELDVFVQPVTPGGAADAFGTMLEAIGDGTRVALARVIAGPRDLLGRALAIQAPEPEQLFGPPGSTVTRDMLADDEGPGRRSVGTLGAASLDRAVVGRAGAMLDLGKTGTFTVGADGSECGEPLTVFVESYGTAPRLLVFGAIDFAAALVTAGKFLGFHVTVCDARPVFATAARFPDADEVVADWPHRYLATQHIDRRTAVCVLTHDEKFDVPLLETALRMPVGYIGAMGSRRTCTQRVERLRERGLDDTELLSRLHSPIGLDLGGRTPQETAIAIVAEIVANRYGGSGRHLAAVSTPIHAAHDTKDLACL
ncbi:XdhC/CoxI family protein [Actinospica sp.]|jgi:xanthine dehydrogenase accessory factor|uniref:XdhC family protein n=1 Tax=Actinospica sp. TaxID=1872142 RepID=UPI002BED010C|nr:XdhC/CoxI family protein [Actinospica sp.]HWG24397.1 XdhC/CoxI family protein [Actinospica sp.]